MTSKKRKRRQAPPSRLRYEENNPTVSFRVPRNLYEELSQLLAFSEQSFADFVKEALGAKEPSVGAAYTHGLTSAKEDYLVTYSCVGCGKIIEVTSSHEKVAARKFFEDGGWGHTKCKDTRHR